MNHLAIPVKNLEKSRLFYERIGFEVFRQWEKPEQKMKAYWMKNKNDIRLELTYHPDNKKIIHAKIPQVFHLGIVVKNLNRMVSKLQKEGINLVVPIAKGKTVKKYTYIKDPSGFSIELLEI